MRAAALAVDAEGLERSDDPFLQRRDVSAHVRPAPVQIEHDVGHALAGPVIGELPAAPGLENRETLLDKLLVLGASAGSVERGMFKEPNEFRRRAVRNRRRARVHEGDCLAVIDKAFADSPFDRRRIVKRDQTSRVFA